MTDQTPTPQPQEKRSWFARHKFLSGLGALVLAIVVINALNGGSNGSSNTDGSNTAAGSTATSTNNGGVTDTADDTGSVAPQPAKHTHKAKPAMSVAQENALRSAQEYLSMTSFSRKGLIEQLSSKAGDQFTHAQAVYAVNQLGF
jgi:hypothetical protein